MFNEDDLDTLKVLWLGYEGTRDKFYELLGGEGKIGLLIYHASRYNQIKVKLEQAEKIIDCAEKLTCNDEYMVYDGYRDVCHDEYDEEGHEELKGLIKKYRNREE